MKQYIQKLPKQVRKQTAQFKNGEKDLTRHLIKDTQLENKHFERQVTISHKQNTAHSMIPKWYMKICTQMALFIIIPN